MIKIEAVDVEGKGNLRNKHTELNTNISTADRCMWSQWLGGEWGDPDERTFATALCNNDMNETWEVLGPLTVAKTRNLIATH